MDFSHAANDEQARLWNGPSGRAWVDNQELLDQVFKPLEELIADAASAKMRNAVLDVVEKPGFLDHVRNIALLFKQRLAEIKDRHPTVIAEVRGEGPTALVDYRAEG